MRPFLSALGAAVALGAAATAVAQSAEDDLITNLPGWTYVRLAQLLASAAVARQRRRCSPAPTLLASAIGRGGRARLRSASRNLPAPRNAVPSARLFLSCAAARRTCTRAT
jgi:hypothetical protein